MWVFSISWWFSACCGMALMVVCLKLGFVGDLGATLVVLCVSGFLCWLVVFVVI